MGRATGPGGKAMTESDSLYVFRRAEDARRFNPRGPGGTAYFENLPFALASGGGTPPPSLLRATFPGYPMPYIRLVRGIDYLVGEGIDVLNLSLGPSSGNFDPSDPLQIATRFAHDCGIPVVVAAGNVGPANGTLQLLALAPWTVAVGATDRGGHELLDSSSRGTPGTRGPTVVGVGYPEVVLIAVDSAPRDFLPGTSFAAARISRALLLIRKCLLLLADSLRDVQQDRWSPESHPIAFSLLGLADTGVDPRALSPLPPEVSALLKTGGESVRLPRDERERRWSSRVLARLRDVGLRPASTPSPGLITRALQMSAKPMEGYRPHEVGAGFVSLEGVEELFSSLTPSRLAILLCSATTTAHVMHLEETLDRELGPLWSRPFVQTLRTYFHDGHRLAVAKVI